MKYVLHYQSSTRSDLERWVSSQPGSEPERRALAKECLNALRAYLIEHRGTPPEAIPVRDLEPPNYWLVFGKGWWMKYCVEIHRRWFCPAIGQITILAIQNESPDREIS